MTSRPPDETIVVRILFFGGARDATSASEVDLHVPSTATVKVVFDKLTERFPDLQRFGRSLLFAVNREYAGPDVKLEANDELAIFPPVSGG
ncbi:MAG TPA: MoaD/ThiS family protein [Pyrinomonadaceae bacterium]|nr:MoaD/ThiS family protein [Pyrinomonadaceae bacterium]